jgi:hypothetical protein
MIAGAGRLPPQSGIQSDSAPVQEGVSDSELRMLHSISCTIPMTGLFACGDIIYGKVGNTDLAWHPCNLNRLSTGFFRLGYTISYTT